VLSAYYRRERRTDDPNAARTTVRLLQSAIRLAQGHARLMCRNKVTLEDAVVAVILLQAGVDSANVLSSIPLKSAFPSDPVIEYGIRAEHILCSLGMHHSWEEEKARLEGLDSRKDEEAPYVCSVMPNSKPHQALMTQVVSKIRSRPIEYGGQPMASGVTEPSKKRKNDSNDLRSVRNKKKKVDKKAKHKESEVNDLRSIFEESEVTEITFVPTSTQAPRGGKFDFCSEVAKEKPLPNLDVSEVLKPKSRCKGVEGHLYGKEVSVGQDGSEADLTIEKSSSLHLTPNGKKIAGIQKSLSKDSLSSKESSSEKSSLASKLSIFACSQDSNSSGDESQEKLLRKGAPGEDKEESPEEKEEPAKAKKSFSLPCVDVKHFLARNTVEPVSLGYISGGKALFEDEDSE